MTLNVNIQENEEKIVMPYLRSVLKQLGEMGVKANIEFAIQKDGYTDMGAIAGEKCACGSSVHLVRNPYGQYDYQCLQCEGE